MSKEEVYKKYYVDGTNYITLDSLSVYFFPDSAYLKNEWTGLIFHKDKHNVFDYLHLSINWHVQNKYPYGYQIKSAYLPNRKK